MTTLTLPMRTEATAAQSSATLLFPAAAGFFFIFRVALTFLFFQASPVTATVVTGVVNILLVYGALLWSAGAAPRTDRAMLRLSPVRWIFALLGFSLISLSWTGAQSTVAALGYWVGMAADVAVVLLLLRRGDTLQTAESLLKGAALGASGLALVGWCIPVTEDLRLGNELFLHPNLLGLEVAMGALVALHLARQGAVWRWLAIGLSITVLRTLSKTAIVAFLAAGCWYLVKNRRWSSAAKLRIAAAALLVFACFWGLLSAYLNAYVDSGSGNQVETLTGRTVLWTVAFSMGMERPWFGHGVYSFKSLIPMLGDFAAVHAHNELMQQFFEYGIAGAAIVIAIYTSFLRFARRAPASELKTLAIALWIFTVVRGLADAQPIDLCFPLWLMAALAVSLAQPLGAKAGLP